MGAARRRGRRLAGGLALGLLAAASGLGAADAPQERFDTVVVDAGHGGDDEGARGPSGSLEKEVVLDVARRLAAALRAGGVRVVMTRDGDATVPLEARTSIANDARGDVFLSIHANAAPDEGVRGSETFFLSLQATDEAAHRLAERENSAFGVAGPLRPRADDLAAVIGGLLADEHLAESQAFASMAQERLGRLDPGGSRGVKQAPFVVLSGVQMPASLVEIGFITNPGEEALLRTARGRARIAAALAESVQEYGRRYDARRGLARRGAGGGSRAHEE
jgi:N-acetylmuramoyl-L-alanine amidase